MPPCKGHVTLFLHWGPHFHIFYLIFWYFQGYLSSDLATSKNLQQNSIHWTRKRLPSNPAKSLIYRNSYLLGQPQKSLGHNGSIFYCQLTLSYTSVRAFPSCSWSPRKVIVSFSLSRGGISTDTFVCRRISWIPDPRGPITYLCWAFFTCHD